MTEAETQRERPQRKRRTRRRSRPSQNDGTTVPLFKRVGSHFQAGDRKRGGEYQRDGRVKMVVRGDQARGKVDGSEDKAYNVGLDWSGVQSDRVLQASCDCPRFDRGRACKHVWACLLELAETSSDSQPVGGNRLKLHKVVNGKPRTEEPPQAQKRSRGRSKRRAPRATWQSKIEALGNSIIKAGAPDPEASDGSDSDERGAEYRFLINTPASQESGAIVLDLFGRSHEPNAKFKRMTADPNEVAGLLSADGNGSKAAIVTSLPIERPNRQGRNNRGRGEAQAGVRRIQLPQTDLGTLLPVLCERDLLSWWDGRTVGEPLPLKWDGSEPWQLVVKLELVTAGRARLHGSIERGEESVDLDHVALIVPLDDDPAQSTEAVFVHDARMARLTINGLADLAWIQGLRESNEILIPKENLEEALTSLLQIPGIPRLEATDEIGLVQETAPMHPRVFLEPDPASVSADPQLLCELSFDYGELTVEASESRPVIVDWEEKKFVQRDMDAEHKALVRLLELGVEPIPSGNGHELELDPHKLSLVAEPLLVDGWAIDVRGTTLRPPSKPSLRVESGIDWFELSGEVDFAGEGIEFREILDAIARGEDYVELADGSQGLVPAQWLEAYGSLSELAHGESDEGLRFLPSQALLVDALLVAMPSTDVDAEFATLRDRLRSFESIEPKKEPRGFGGTLRGYQREGLGWLEFLREYGLGGVLADDMGLGKTVQVLALIKTWRTPAKSTKLPILVVAPRSLVYNWMDEAKRFTPKLKVTQYLGAQRENLKGEFDQWDVLITSYGTLRRDAAFLAGIEFDTVILDEAQAIKNPESQTSKASRLLKARNRLALTGTPIENHLGELGSILDFLNPGLLGRLPKLDVLMSGGAPSKAELELVAQGVKPFILRRTKGQVLKDLPPKTEQVLSCSLHPAQREIYDQLRASYQASLLEKVESEGVAGSTMQVLEALLRLRQAACHPGLIDERFEGVGSAKLERLFDSVSEVLEEGHKVLVFSQFTKLLGFVRARMDEEGINYAYLDGQTRDRGAVVDTFQNDPDCNLFLISLKAGGVGLNLTAAGYVFLLDPWWNPAVEAQAIDRAHRIGQTQPVFAYRMIAEDTVEEKIVELQQSKKQLAEAILDGGEGTSLRDLTADDLRVLLS